MPEISVKLAGPIWDVSGEDKERTVDFEEDTIAVEELVDRVSRDIDEVKENAFKRGEIDSAISLIVDDRSFNLKYDGTEEIDLEDKEGVVLLLINTWDGG